jgi:ankyrin repeat protein
LEAVKVLLEVPGIDLNARDDRGCTALFFAGVKNYPEIVTALVRAGIDPTIKSNPQPGRPEVTAMDLALQFECREALLNMVVEATKKGFKIDGRLSASVVFDEIQAGGDVAVIKELFELCPDAATFTFEKTGQGLPFLCAAADQHNLEVVSLLLEKGQYQLITLERSKVSSSSAERKNLI